ncbi:L-lactate dehydrogenase [Alicyclobacillus tolerans]|uniref:L-lactate dehydrogenase n=1 Tax=Alicyclobacillus tolerans TaxID=90970 RepID=UPI001EFFA6AD|nr:L-lactate dehydrogenase [Alicyclobacillus tolerans]MCF8567526.1 L-lactate dehydrogenase [Alicyclobacillus tolerans]
MKVAIIGSGAVGSTTAYTLLLRKRVNELVLIDVNQNKAMGDAFDLSHGLPFIGAIKVYAGEYKDCADADIIIVTAGVAQKPNETRQDLLARNLQIFDAMIPKVTQRNKNGILLIATNPVDILSYFSWKKSGWDWNRVIGSGTLLDSARFRYLIANKLNVDPRSVHAHIVGEHGDTELPLWSHTNIAGMPIGLSEVEKQDLFKATRDAAYQIISTKGSTYYAIALALDRIVESILFNESSVLNVSTLLQNFHGISDVYLGVPCVVNRQGIHEVLPIEPSPVELEKLKYSANELKKQIAAFGL